MAKKKGPISMFINRNYKHFNSAALKDAAIGYETHIDNGGKMLVSLAGAMSTAELGISLAEMIRAGKVDIISCTGLYSLNKINPRCVRFNTRIIAFKSRINFSYTFLFL